MTKESCRLSDALSQYGVALRAVTVALTQGLAKEEVDARFVDVEIARREFERIALVMGFAGRFDASSTP